MPPFRPKDHYTPPHDDRPEAAPAATSEFDPRDQLREAIEAANAAERALGDLEAAETAAFERKYRAEDRLEIVKERHRESQGGGADAFLVAMRAGADIGVAELEASDRAKAEEIETAEREIAALGRVREQIADRIPAASEARDRAKRKVVDLAKAVLAEQLDADALIEAGERAYAALSDAMARIRFAASLFPYHSPDGQRLHFWPETHFRNEDAHADCRRDPANADLVAAFERLLVDADAEVPPS